MELITIIQIFVLIFSVILHELGHGYAALALGDHTAKQQNRLSLNPIQHVDPFFTIIMPCILIFMNLPPIGGAKPVPVNPTYFKYTSPRRGMLLVAAAGPLVNFCICLVTLCIIYIGSSFHHDIVKVGLFFSLFLNGLLMSFNLLPIPPLDGSKILIGLLPQKQAFKFMVFERFGLFALIILVIMGALFPLVSFIHDISLDLLPNNYFTMAPLDN